MQIQSDGITAEIHQLGAELLSLVANGAEWLWSGDERSWPRRAPVLFPVVGGCADFVLRHKGRSYPAPKSHGFAPDSVFTVLSLEDDRCLLRLRSDRDTRPAYPFEFVLDVSFVVKGRSIEQTARVTNVGEEVMPASVGFHPGFRWPLPSLAPNVPMPKDHHVLLFEADEIAPIRRPVSRLLSKESEPNPVVSKRLKLSDDIFAKGAIVFDKLASRSIWFGVSGKPGVQLNFDMPHLGLWMIPGAEFLCIEPWQGHACPEDFSGEILEKPGMFHLNPGESFSRQMVITIDASPSQFP